MPATKQRTDTTSVFLIDDHPPVRTASQRTIEAEDDLTVCGEAPTAHEAFREIEAQEPDVAVVDISLADAHGIDLIQNVEAQYPEVETIVFSMYNERVYAERAIHAGASAYVMKSKPTKHIVKAIRSVENGELYLSRGMTSRLLNKVATGHSSDSNTATDELTDREMAVFQMLGQGYSVQEIQGRLNLARKTIETYRRRAKEKLEFDTVAELLRYAIKWTQTQGPNQDTKSPPSDQTDA